VRCPLCHFVVIAEFLYVTTKFENENFGANIDQLTHAILAKCHESPSPVRAVFRYAKVCTITGPANAVAGPVSRGARFCSIHLTARLFDSSAPA
jgi:hypothetical protein